MTDQLLFDKVRYMDRLRQDAGLGEAAARAYADALESALHESVATKSDIARLGSDIAALRSDLRSEVARLESKIEITARDITIRIGGMLVVATGILIAIRYFG